MADSKELWTNLHRESRYRPKYPSESVVQYIFRNFKRDGKEKVLDLGCGAGRHIFLMATEGIIPYGLDFSHEGVAYTQKMLENMGQNQYMNNIKEGSMVNIPFEDNFFDGIICFGSLYYLNYSDIKKSVNEMERVLKKNGKFMCVVRSTSDYRCNETNCQKTDEENTYYINVGDTNKCAHSENGMLMHFFTKDEVKELFKDFEELNINEVTETHDNGAFCDSNYIITGVKK